MYSGSSFLMLYDGADPNGPADGGVQVDEHLRAEQIVELLLLGLVDHREALERGRLVRA